MKTTIKVTGCRQTCCIMWFPCESMAFLLSFQYKHKMTVCCRLTWTCLAGTRLHIESSLWMSHVNSPSIILTNFPSTSLYATLSRFFVISTATSAPLCMCEGTLTDTTYHNDTLKLLHCKNWNFCVPYIFRPQQICGKITGRKYLNGNQLLRISLTEANLGQLSLPSLQGR